MGIAGSEDAEMGWIIKAFQSFLSEIKSPPFSLPVQSKIERLLVGIGSRVHECRIRFRRQPKKATESLAAELLQDSAAWRNLPARYSLVIVKGNFCAQLCSFLQEEIEHGMESGMVIVHQMGKETVLDKFF